jgi:hypothetical protein
MQDASPPPVPGSVHHLPARYDHSDAEAYFTRAGWTRLYGLLGHPARPVPRKTSGGVNLPFLERIWMPWYAVEFNTEIRMRLNTVTIALDAWSGMIVLFERGGQLREGAPEGAVFVPPFGAEQAMTQARQGLFQVILRRRGQLNKPQIRDCQSIRLFYMPYWVYYHRRLFRYIDCRLMDAYSGEAAGSRTRHGLLNALVSQPQPSGLVDGSDTPKNP